MKFVDHDYRIFQLCKTEIVFITIPWVCLKAIKTIATWWVLIALTSKLCWIHHLTIYACEKLLQTAQIFRTHFEAHVAVFCISSFWKSQKYSYYGGLIISFHEKRRIWNSYAPFSTLKWQMQKKSFQNAFLIWRLIIHYPSLFGFSACASHHVYSTNDCLMRNFKLAEFVGMGM